MGGPLFIFYPVLVVGAAMTIAAVVTEPEKAANGLMLVAGFIGLTGLLLSIVLPLRWMRERAWVRHGVAAAMLVGVALALFFIVAAAPDLLQKGELSSLWMFAGPVVVAAWNLWRIYHPGPGSKELVQFPESPGARDDRLEQ